MTRTCYLHLGLTKTGSTAIQSSFHGYEDDRLIYAPAPRANHTVFALARFSENPRSVNRFARLEPSESELRAKVGKLSDTFERIISGEKDVVLSGEGIPNHLKPRELKAMLAYLQGRFDTVIPIFYLRPFASLASSRFQQSVKTGNGAFHLSPPRMRAKIEPVIQQAGRDAVRFVRYDRAGFDGGNVVADFAARVGASRVPELADTPNASLSTEAMAALFAFNKFSAPFLRRKKQVEVKNLLEARLTGLGETKFGLSGEIIERFIAENAEDIAWTKSICGFDLKGEVAPVPEPVTSEAHLLSFADALVAKA